MWLLGQLKSLLQYSGSIDSSMVGRLFFVTVCRESRELTPSQNRMSLTIVLSEFITTYRVYSHFYSFWVARPCRSLAFQSLSFDSLTVYFHLKMAERQGRQEKTKHKTLSFFEMYKLFEQHKTLIEFYVEQSFPGIHRQECSSLVRVYTDLNVTTVS